MNEFFSVPYSDSSSVCEITQDKNTVYPYSDSSSVCEITQDKNIVYQFGTDTSDLLKKSNTNIDYSKWDVLASQFGTDTSDEAIQNKVNPLHIACEKGMKKVVKNLIRAKVDLDKTTKDGGTALHIACQQGHKSIVRELVKANAKVDKMTKNGATPLLIACKFGYHTIVQELLRNKAEFNKQMRDEGTPLHIACQQGHDRIIQLLLEAKCNVNKVAKNGDTPLMISLRMGKNAIVKELIQAKADVGTVMKMLSKQESHLSEETQPRENVFGKQSTIIDYTKWDLLAANIDNDQDDDPSHDGSSAMTRILSILQHRTFVNGSNDPTTGDTLKVVFRATKSDISRYELIRCGIINRCASLFQQGCTWLNILSSASDNLEDIAEYVPDLILLWRIFSNMCTTKDIQNSFLAENLLDPFVSSLSILTLYQISMSPSTMTTNAIVREDDLNRFVRNRLQFLLQCGLRLLSNLVTNNKGIQDLVWLKCFPGLFSQMLIVSNGKLLCSLCTLIYNSICKSQKRVRMLSDTKPGQEFMYQILQQEWMVRFDDKKSSSAREWIDIIFLKLLSHESNKNNLAYVISLLRLDYDILKKCKMLKRKNHLAAPPSLTGAMVILLEWLVQHVERTNVLEDFLKQKIIVQYFNDTVDFFLSMVKKPNKHTHIEENTDMTNEMNKFFCSVRAIASFLEIIGHVTSHMSMCDCSSFKYKTLKTTSVVNERKENSISSSHVSALPSSLSSPSCPSSCLSLSNFCSICDIIPSIVKVFHVFTPPSYLSTESTTDIGSNMQLDEIVRRLRVSLIVRVIGNISSKNSKHQDLIGKHGGCELLFSHMRPPFDPNHIWFDPMLREWSLFALRSLTLNNVSNQDVLRNLGKRPVGIHPQSRQELNKMGVSPTFDPATGEIRIANIPRKNNKTNN